MLPMVLLLMFENKGPFRHIELYMSKRLLEVSQMTEKW